MATPKYPIGIQTFSEIIQGGYAYADKTDLAFKLANYAKYCFLSRPRRFGKSLLVTTLQAYFEGRRSLFAGLKMEGLEKDWVRYPVVHIDLSIGRYSDVAAAHSNIGGILSELETKYGIEPISPTAYGSRLGRIIDAASRQSRQKVVVLVDEYDAPMLDSLSSPQSQSAIRGIMRDLFSPLKSKEQMLRFVFITGISKFSQMSIFSELNSIKNVSMSDEFACVCGITEGELEERFAEGVGHIASKLGISRDDAMARLKLNYDGYHFSPGCHDVYNPYSLLNSFMDGQIKNYWFASGTPTFLIELLHGKGLDMLQLDNVEATEDRFDTPTDSISDPVPVLYQSGYLTIKSYDPVLGKYTLGWPNAEVKNGFSNSLLRYFVPDGIGKRDALYFSFVHNLLLGDDMDSFMHDLKRFYDAFPYTLVNRNERHYQAVLYTIFTMVGAHVEAEHATANGRIDLVLYTRSSIYVFELKHGHDASTAMRQIDGKRYTSAFAADQRKKYKVAVNFSDDQRSIDGWIVDPD